MRKWGGALVAAAVVLGAGAASAAPLEAYGKLPAVEDVAISPDGSRLAMIQTDGEKRNIRIENLAQHKMERLLDGGLAKLRALVWAGADHLIVLRTTTADVEDISGGRREYQLGFDYNLATGTAHPLMGDLTNSLNTFRSIQVSSVDDKTMLFIQGIYFPHNRGILTVFRVDLQNEKSAVVEKGIVGTSSFVLGADGAPVARTDWDGDGKRWSLKLKTDGAWREVRSGQYEFDAPVLSGLGRDGRSVVVTEQKDDREITREVSPTGAWGEPLGVTGTEGLIFAPIGHNLIGFSDLVGDDDRYTFFDPHDQAVWTLVKHAYPGQRVQLVSWTDDRKKIVVLADSPTEGPGYALIDLTTHHADWIANRYAQLGPEDISPVKAVQFKAADGLQLSGYLTMPRGRVARGLPLVVLPHGGPAARDEPGFDWLAQAMASRGYAVLQVNFRGSKGFGLGFAEAGYGQWGRKMQTDLSDGVRYLASQGTIDPKKVCIVGASYGGYAAMAGPTLDPGVYRCAVAYGGLSDMRAVVGSYSPRSRRGILRFTGAKDLGDARLAEISPAYHADKVTVPMLIIHGRDDTVVPLRQSLRMAEALKVAGKPVDLLVLDSTDHWLTRGDTRLAMLKATMAFLEKNNPPN